jgi:hypothetical protein
MAIKRGTTGAWFAQRDTDQRDPKGVWPNLSRRSTQQQDTKENSI